MSLEISSTDDVPEDVLENLVAELPAGFKARPSDYRLSLCSVEPPSWFALVAELDWWLKILGGWAAIYLASIANAAGKETWERRAEVVAHLHKVAKAILRARRKCRKNTHVELAIDLGENHYEAKYYLEGEEENEVATNLALFVYFAPNVVKLVKDYEKAGNRISGWVSLRVREDGLMEVNWMDAHSLENIQHVLSKKNP